MSNESKPAREPQGEKRMDAQENYKDIDGNDIPERNRIVKTEKERRIYQDIVDHVMRQQTTERTTMKLNDFEQELKRLLPGDRPFSSKCWFGPTPAITMARPPHLAWMALNEPILTNKGIMSGPYG